MYTRYILYGGRFTRALVVEMVLLEGDIPYELREIDIVNDEHRGAEYLAINPAGWVPALITPEGQTLYETPALNLYLAERHRLTHLVPRVEKPERGLFLSGLFSVHDDLEPIMKRYFYPHRTALREEDTPAVKQLALEAALDYLTVVETRRGQHGPYHLGERFSLVDLVMAYWTTLIEEVGALEACPVIKQCMDDVVARPKIHHKFDEQAEWRIEYAQMQTRGEGVK